MCVLRASMDKAKQTSRGYGKGVGYKRIWVAENKRKIAEERECKFAAELEMVASGIELLVACAHVDKMEDDK